MFNYITIKLVMRITYIVSILITPMTMKLYFTFISIKTEAFGVLFYIHIGQNLFTKPITTPRAHSTTF